MKPRFLAVWLACLAVSHGEPLPDGALGNLRSEDFHKREAAQTELLKWSRERPAEAMEELFRQSRSADDPEVRERCLDVLRDLVGDEYFKDGEGYMGIRMGDELANVPGDPKPRAVIRVTLIVEESAAAQAGLKMNDLIVGLGDQVWHEGIASRIFGDRIRQEKPDTKVTLKVLRDGNLMDLEVKLGRRPLLADNPFMEESSEEIAAAEKAAKEAYFRRWLLRRKSQN